MHDFISALPLQFVWYICTLHEKQCKAPPLTSQGHRLKSMSPKICTLDCIELRHIHRTLRRNNCAISVLLHFDQQLNLIRCIVFTMQACKAKKEWLATATMQTLVWGTSYCTYSDLSRSLQLGEPLWATQNKSMMKSPTSSPASPSQSTASPAKSAIPSPASTATSPIASPASTTPAPMSAAISPPAR